MTMSTENKEVLKSSPPFNSSKNGKQQDLTPQTSEDEENSE